MSGFVIKIAPPVPEAKPRSQPISLDGLDYDLILRQCPEEYDVIYYIAGKPFSYYPSSMVTVLNDLHEEWDLAKRRQSHSMTLCGYTVLEVEFADRNAIFLDPISYHRLGMKIPVAEPIPAEVVEGAFRSAVANVLGFINSVSQKD